MLLLFGWVMSHEWTLLGEYSLSLTWVSEVRHWSHLPPQVETKNPACMAHLNRRWHPLMSVYLTDCSPRNKSDMLRWSSVREDGSESLCLTNGRPPFFKNKPESWLIKPKTESSIYGIKLITINWRSTTEILILGILLRFQFCCKDPLYPGWHKRFGKYTYLNLGKYRK